MFTENRQDVMSVPPSSNNFAAHHNHLKKCSYHRSPKTLSWQIFSLGKSRYFMYCFHLVLNVLLCFVLFSF